MKKIFLLLPLLVLWSCNEDETIIQLDENNNFNPYPKGFFVNTPEGIDTVKFEYKNNLVTKRIGEWMQLPAPAGYSEIFTKLFETHATYTGNKAVVERVSKMEGTNFPKDIQTYSFDGKKITEAIFTYQNRANYLEKYVYTYKDNQIKSIDLFVTDSYYVNDLRSRNDFYFNTKGNLDSLVYREAAFDFYNESIPPYIDYSLKNRKVTVFSNYDESQNPFQNLGIFLDLYNKSLSKNNFRAYETKEYDKDGKPTINISSSSWIYEYVNGEVKVLK